MQASAGRRGDPCLRFYSSSVNRQPFRGLRRAPFETAGPVEKTLQKLVVLDKVEEFETKERVRKILLKRNSFFWNQGTKAQYLLYALPKEFREADFIPNYLLPLALRASHTGTERVKFEGTWLGKHLLDREWITEENPFPLRKFMVWCEERQKSAAQFIEIRVLETVESFLNSHHEFATGHDAITLEVAAHTLVKVLKQFCLCDTFNRETYKAEVYELLHKVCVQDEDQVRKAAFNCLVDWQATFPVDKNYWDIRREQWSNEPTHSKNKAVEPVHIAPGHAHQLKLIPPWRRENLALMRVVFLNIKSKKAFREAGGQFGVLAGEIFHVETEDQVWVDPNN